MKIAHAGRCLARKSPKIAGGADFVGFHQTITNCSSYNILNLHRVYTGCFGCLFLHFFELKKVFLLTTK